MSRRAALHLVAMLALGAVVLAGLGALVEWRHGREVVPAGASGIDTGRRPIVVLARGVLSSARVAREELAGGHRGEAMHAVDATLRVAKVGRHAARGPLRWALHQAVFEVGEARIDVQNGAPGAARRHLAELAGVVREAAPRAAAAGAPAPHEWDELAGAALLDATGARIGEVETLESRGDGEPVARLRVGGSSEVLGFLDVGGAAVEVPLDRLLFGEPRFGAVTHVVAPVTTREPAAVRSRLGDPPPAQVS